MLYTWQWLLLMRYAVPGTFLALTKNNRMSRALAIVLTSPP